MTTNRDWKLITRRAKEMHEKFGGSCITMEGENAFALGDPLCIAYTKTPRLILPNAQPGPTGGGTFPVAMLRTFYYEHRNHSCLQEPDPVIWTLYDPQSLVIVAGLGNLIPESKVQFFKDKGFEVMVRSEEANA